MELGFIYWIVAWTMMGLAFVTAFLTILVGAISLDRNTSTAEEFKSAASTSSQNAAE